MWWLFGWCLFVWCLFLWCPWAWCLSVSCLFAWCIFSWCLWVWCLLLSWLSVWCLFSWMSLSMILFRLMPFSVMTFNMMPFKGTFTRNSFWPQHSKILVRKRIVLGMVHLIYMATIFFSMFTFEWHPWNRNGTLKFMSPCTYTYDSSSHLISSTLLWAVQKENGRFPSTKSNCLAQCFEKAKMAVTNARQNRVILCTTLTCIKAAT